MNAKRILKVIIGSIMLFSTFGLFSCGKSVETTTHKITDSFSNISVRLDSADLIFIHSDSECRIEASKRKKVTYRASVVDGELKIEVVDGRAWYEKLFSFGKNSVKVYLPKTDYDNLKIANDTGDVEIKNFNFGNAEIILHAGDIEIENCSFNALSVENNTGYVDIDETKVNDYLNISTDTGNVDVDGATCDKLKIEVDTGKITLDNVIAVDIFDISGDTGDIEFDSCDAGEVYIKTNTGDVEGSFLTDKIVFAETDTGKVKVPKLTTGGRCEISTNTGDIKITIK